MADTNRLYILGSCILVVLMTLNNRCATPGIQYGGLPLVTPRGYDMPIITPEELTGKERSVDMEKIEYYRNLMAQEYEFVPPVKIVVIFPPPRLFLYLIPPRRSMTEEMLQRLFYETISERLKESEFISDIVPAAQFLYHYSFNEIQEVGARYRADQCLIVFYDLIIWHPSMCLGFWPLNYKEGRLNSQIVLLDTRTGFVLMNESYYLSHRSSDAPSTGDKERAVITGLVAEWAAQLSEDIPDFYRREID